MTNIARIKKLAGLLEAEHILSQDETDAIQDREDDARYAREERIVELIEFAFKKMKIDLAFESPIFYDEQTDREAIVKLDEPEISVKKLAQILQSGLGEDYKVSIGTDHVLDITFKVSLELDSAKMT